MKMEMSGDRIRARRKALGLNQEQLAERVGMPGGQSYISAIERGEVEPGLPLLRRIADALGWQIQVTVAERVTQPQEAATSAA